MLAFKYLSCLLTAANNDWPEVVANLQKSRKKLARMSRIIVQEGEN